LAYGAGLGYLRFQAAGWRIDDTQLTLRYSRFLKHTLIMKKHKIQCMEMRQSWFQKRKRLGSLYSTIVSGGTGKKGKALNLDKDDVAAIYQWFQSTHFIKSNET
jgi:putative membrane protein